MDLSQVCRRRMQLIAGHMGARRDSTSSPAVTTLECSVASDIHSGNRKDNRILYARQGSQSRAFYMRQSTGSQVVLSNEEGTVASQHVFDRPASSRVKHSISEMEWELGEPSFGIMGVKEYRGSTLDEGPLFAQRANDSDNKMQTSELVQSQSKQTSNKHIGLEWSPRMDVVESSSAYVVTVELSGVNAEGIRVEVNNNRLIIAGTRLSERWLNLNENNKGAIYHRRELSQGPYRVIWHIPDDSNVNAITAEFIDGFLQILVPKLVP